MPRASSAGRREMPASSDADPGIVVERGADTGAFTAVSGRPPSSPPCEPVTTTCPASSAPPARSESSAKTRTPRRPAAVDLAPRLVHRRLRPRRPAGRAAARRARASAAAMPSARPSAAAGAFTADSSPRASMSAPSPIRAVMWPTQAAGTPRAASQSSPPRPARSRPTPASCRINGRDAAPCRVPGRVDAAMARAAAPRGRPPWPADASRCRAPGRIRRAFRLLPRLDSFARCRMLRKPPARGVG